MTDRNIDPATAGAVNSLISELSDTLAVARMSPEHRRDAISITDALRTIVLEAAEPKPDAYPWHDFRLTKDESIIAKMLRRTNGQLVTRNAIYDAIYSLRPNNPQQIKIVDVWISKIRSKLKAANHPMGIETVWGMGYKMLPANLCHTPPGSDKAKAAAARRNAIRQERAQSKPDQEIPSANTLVE